MVSFNSFLFCFYCSFKRQISTEKTPFSLVLPVSKPKVDFRFWKNRWASEQILMNFFMYTEKLSLFFLVYVKNFQFIPKIPFFLIF